jgi:addiction module HigA family antidote
MIPILFVEPLNLERLNETSGGAMNNRLLTEHPGRILLEEFLAPRGVSVWHLAKDIGVPARRIYEIVQGQRPITADIAHRLAHYFGMSERYWLDLQAQYDGKREDKSIKEVPTGQSLRYAG